MLAERGQENDNIFCPLPGMRGWFATRDYPLNFDCYSPGADFTDLVQKSPCGSAWMVQAEPEAICEH